MIKYRPSDEPQDGDVEDVMREAPTDAQLFNPQGWDDIGPLVVAGALVMVAAYTVVRLALCQNALQRIGELVRALGLALLIAAISLLVGLLPTSAQLYARLDQQELPVMIAATSALGALGWAIPVRIVHLGTTLYWHGSWTFSRPLLASPYRGKPSPSPRPASTRNFRLVGMLLWLTGWTCKVVGVVGALWQYGNFMAAALERSITLHSLWFIASAAMVWAGQAILKRARRYLAPVLRSEADLPAGSYLLYLRPFTIDQDRAVVEQPIVEANPGASLLFGMLMTGGSDERQIAATLRPVGTVVAVGAPGERLPYRGAMRMYLPKNRWQPTVARLIMRARLVVLTLASSDGTMWELAEAMRTLPAQRLILIVPSMRREKYEDIRAQNIENLCNIAESARNPTWKNNRVPSLPGRLPDVDHASLVSMGLIRFSAEWQPSFVKIPSRDPISAAWGWSLCYDLRRGLRPALEQLYAYEQRTSRTYG